LLVRLHPLCCYRTPTLDYCVDDGKIITEVAGENWFVVRDTVTQYADVLQRFEHPIATIIGFHVRREVWEVRAKVWYPQTAVVTACKHSLPESKFQFWDSLPAVVWPLLAASKSLRML
jgi:hypothetical protein